MKRVIPLLLALGSCSTTLPPRGLERQPRCEFIGAAGYVVVPLEHVSAEQVASTINDLLNESAKRAFERTRGSCVLYRPDALPPEPAPRVRILADPETNSVFVKAPQDDLPRLLELIARMDGRWRRDSR